MPLFYLILLLLALLVTTVHAFIPLRPPVTPTHQHSTLASPSSRPCSRTSPRMSAASAPAAAPAPTPTGVTRSVVQLPTGLAMEVLTAGPAAATATATAPTDASKTGGSSAGQQNPLETFLSGLFDAFGGSSSSRSPVQAAAAKPAAKANKRHPLVFVHGSFHSAWCWAEHFLPFFAERVRPCVV